MHARIVDTLRVRDVDLHYAAQGEPEGLLRAMLDQDDADRLRRIAGPTLIIWGDQDAFAGRADQRRLTEAIPGARLVVHAGIGHAPHWEDATRAASDIVAFIDDRRVLAA